MRVMLMAKDKEGALDIRKANRDAHLAYLKETGVVEQAGPLLNEAGEMAGSLLVMEVADLGAAKAWAENDPYAKAGLFAEVHISAWNRVIG